MSKEDEAKKTIKIENVVASTSIGHEIDLISLVKTLEGVEYNPKRFPGMIYRTKDPKMAALIFGSGKIVCTGAKSIANLETGVRKVFGELASAGVDTDGEPDITVQNIVFSANLETVLNLSSLAIGLGLENIEYEPEVFPGLVYRIDQPKVVVLMFSSGKLVITGGKKPQDAEAAVEHIVSELKSLALL
jgi:transcription initiation factor TFIID TATA-box-binding protein